jgi:hypothetical protein
VIDKAAHTFFLEYPDEVNRDVLAFLRRSSEYTPPAETSNGTGESSSTGL